MKELRTVIEIHATAEKVWQILIDLNKWPDWNPFITQAIGKPQLGEKVDITAGTGSKAMVLHCTVTKVAPNSELTWKYHVGLPVLFQGEHSMRIEPAGEGHVRFVDCEVVTGLLVPLQSRNIDTNSRRGFEAMDQALKKQAEQA